MRIREDMFLYVSVFLTAFFSSSCCDHELCIGWACAIYRARFDWETSMNLVHKWWFYHVDEIATHKPVFLRLWMERERKRRECEWVRDDELLYKLCNNVSQCWRWHNTSVCAWSSLKLWCGISGVIKILLQCLCIVEWESAISSSFAFATI